MLHFIVDPKFLLVLLSVLVVERIVSHVRHRTFVNDTKLQDTNTNARLMRITQRVETIAKQQSGIANSWSDDMTKTHVFDTKTLFRYPVDVFDAKD